MTDCVESKNRDSNDNIDLRVKNIKLKANVYENVAKSKSCNEESRYNCFRKAILGQQTSRKIIPKVYNKVILKYNSQELSHRFNLKLVGPLVPLIEIKFNLSEIINLSI
ncbi:hypothetical protein BpHYR1_011795 [Brachionus plicatilis]|uniref:Uncharacterized protein n=1 Tax=Brachionus plicatilis TaxID=10195 RepID=A0A3M7T997_BRAPC|nr:hypothetical protein BpHYR1_011795 [Brachionus plicatilis]